VKPGAPVGTVVRDIRLLMPGLFGWLTCVLATLFRPPGSWVWWGLGILVVLVWLALQTGRKGLLLFVPLLLIATVMVGAVWANAIVRDQPQLMDRDGDRVSATITLEQTITPGARSAKALVTAVDHTALVRGPVPVRVVGDLVTSRTALGSETVVVGQLQRGPSGDQQAWVLFVSEKPEAWTPPGSFLLATDVLRASFLERSLQREGDAGQLLPGLAIGDTSAVDDGLVQAMRETSLSHLVAVSGANCAIIVALVVALVALFGGGLWVRMVAGVAALVGFVILVTPEPSITRAAVMASIVLIFLASSRPVRGIPVLGTTVLILLAIDPWLSTDFAFALSVLATGGILLLSGPLVRAMSAYLPPGVALVLALPLAAQIACQPLLIVLNPIIPVWAVVANAIAAPAAPVATILGMLACIAGPLSTNLADAIVWVAWLPSGYISAIARVLAATPMAVLPWPEGWFGVLAVAIIGYGGIAWLLLRTSSHTIFRRFLGWGSAGAVVVVVLGFFVPQSATKASIPADWTVAQCDVGQGDAIVLRSKDTVVVIDVGELPKDIARCLAMLGVDHIDLLVITHFDKDHVGGWTAVIDRVSEVWIGDFTSDKELTLVQEMSDRGPLVRQVSRGHNAVVGGYELLVVWPTTTPLAAPGNDSSVVILATPGPECPTCLSGIYLGDLGEQAQRILDARETLPTVDIVKVSHHGSRDQYPALYRGLLARVGLIGVGKTNSYGHPHKDIIEIVEESGVVLRSDRDGLVTLHRSETDGIVKWSEY
jgi:competence protein ComEC